MKKLINYIFISSILILFTACSQKITIKALKPSIVEDSSVKKISIERIKNDDISLSSNIQSKMNNVRFNNKKYFTITNRNQLPSILKEQKIQDSGLVNLSRNKQFGVGEVESILSGFINNKQYDKNEFYEIRTNYDKCIQYKTDSNNNKQCTQYQTYNVICSDNIYTIRAYLSINKLEGGSLIYSRNFEKQKVLKYCNDYNTKLPKSHNIYHLLSNAIANDLVKEISPTYQYFTVVLIKDEDIEYTNSQEKMLENSLKLIELNYLVKAKLLLEELVLSTKSKSATALYNLGVVCEGLDDLNKAYTLYKKAENITILNNFDENIISAVKRIEKSLLNNKKAMRQIDN